MRLILVPPYRGAGYDFDPQEEPYYQRVLESLRQRGQLDGVTVEIDPGVHTDHVAASRDDALFDHLAVAVQARVRDICSRGDHDAIVVLGAIDVGFHATRVVADVPVLHPLHSSLHVASLLADRFSFIDVSDPQAARVRRLARAYGLDHKLASVRNFGRSSTDTSPVLRNAARGGRPSSATEQVLDEVTTQCGRAVDEDGAEMLIIGFTPLQSLEHEIRSRLDAAGYDEVPVVWVLSAAVAMAKATFEMGLRQAPRTFPVDSLRAKPDKR